MSYLPFINVFLLIIRTESFAAYKFCHGVNGGIIKIEWTHAFEETEKKSQTFWKLYDSERYRCHYKRINQVYEKLK